MTEKDPLAPVVVTTVKQKADGVTMPELVRILGNQGISEQRTRATVERLVETGPLALDVSMKLRLR